MSSKRLKKMMHINLTCLRKGAELILLFSLVHVEHSVLENKPLLGIT